MRAFIDLMESAGLGDVTAQKVIAYARDPNNPDVNESYKEQIDHAFDGSQDEMDHWLLSMTADVKARVASHARQEIMYRGFQTEPTEPLGIHWTVNYDMAEQFAAGGPILEAFIDPHTVDWLGSVVRGIFWENDQEDELCLLVGSEVRLTDGRTMRV